MSKRNFCEMTIRYLFISFDKNYDREVTYCELSAVHYCNKFSNPIDLKIDT